LRGNFGPRQIEEIVNLARHQEEAETNPEPLYDGPPRAVEWH
jgi:hypothetical protein